MDYDYLQFSLTIFSAMQTLEIEMRQIECKRASDVARAIFYSENTFAYPPIDGVEMWQALHYNK